MQNEHKEEWSKTYVAKYSEAAGGKNEKVEQEKPEKNMIEATHERTNVRSVKKNTKHNSNTLLHLVSFFTERTLQLLVPMKKKLKQKSFLRKLPMDFSQFIMEVVGVQKQSRHRRQ